MVVAIVAPGKPGPGLLSGGRRTLGKPALSPSESFPNSLSGWASLSVIRAIAKGGKDLLGE